MRREPEDEAIGLIGPMGPIGLRGRQTELILRQAQDDGKKGTKK